MKSPELEIVSLAKYCNESLILAILSQNQLHGYQIAIELEQKSGGLFRFNYGTLYPILHNLEQEELINGLWIDEGITRKRKYYSITEKGHTYLNNQQEKWQKFFTVFFTIIGIKLP